MHTNYCEMKWNDSADIVRTKTDIPNTMLVKIMQTTERLNSLALYTTFSTSFLLIRFFLRLNYSFFSNKSSYFYLYENSENKSTTQRLHDIKYTFVVLILARSFIAVTFLHKEMELPGFSTTFNFVNFNLLSAQLE